MVHELLKVQYKVFMFKYLRSATDMQCLKISTEFLFKFSLIFIIQTSSIDQYSPNHSLILQMQSKLHRNTFQKSTLLAV